MVMDTLRKRFSLWIFKTKEEQYHPRDEERLHDERTAKRARDKERSRSTDTTKHHAASAGAKKSKKPTPLYEKKQLPSYSSLENASASAFHRSSPVCRKLRVNTKSVM